jgi:N-formylglutamate deformylase
MGYSVALNDPYQGVEIVRRYGQPDLRHHALQVEINRRLYMDESRFEKHQGFAALQKNMTRLFDGVAQIFVRNQTDILAAE